MNFNRRIFWGALLVILGILFLLESLGILTVEVGQIFFPLAIILVGGWIIYRSFNRQNTVQQQETLSLPVEQITSANVLLKHGAGRIWLAGQAGANELVSGSFGGGVQHLLNSRAARQIWNYNRPVVGLILFPLLIKGSNGACVLTPR